MKKVIKIEYKKVYLYFLEIILNCVNNFIYKFKDYNILTSLPVCLFKSLFI